MVPRVQSQPPNIAMKTTTYPFWRPVSSYVRRSLTKPDKDLLFLLIFPKLILQINGVVVHSLGQVDDIRGRQVHTIVQVAEEEHVCKLVCQVKLGQSLVFEDPHAL